MKKSWADFGGYFQVRRLKFSQEVYVFVILELDSRPQWVLQDLVPDFQVGMGRQLRWALSEIFYSSDALIVG